MSADHEYLYARKQSTYFGAARTDYVNALPSCGSSRVLEIGCGNGATGAFALTHKRAVEWVGIELFQPIACEAKNSLSHVLIGDVEEMDLPYKHGYFDALVASEVIEHLVDPWTLLDKILPLIKPGGRIFASSPNISNWRVIYGLFGGNFIYNPLGGVMDESHLRWFTPTSFEALFTKRNIRRDYLGPIWPELQPKWQRMFPERFQYLLWRQINFHGTKL